MKTDLFCKQTSLNLVIFDKNEGNFRKAEMFQWISNSNSLLKSVVTKTHFSDNSFLLCYIVQTLSKLLKEYSKFISEA